MHFALRRVALALFLVFSSALRAASAALIETGEIAGAKFTLARPVPPAKWNSRLLLIAHGYRDVKAPLVADLFPDQLATKTLVAEGWIVAKTSYRRNGLVIADGLADLDALRAHVAKTHGAPTRVLLEGESMGGLIVTLAAEREPALYAGAVAIGAALNIKEPGSILAPSGQPKIPLLFLTNQSELDGPAAYVAAATQTAPALRPVLFRVPPAPVASQVVPAADARGFTARVTEVSAVYGNVFIDAQPADFAAAGIAPGTWFELTAHDKTYRTFYGKNFDSVKRGEWVVFANADGFFWLSRNWENAAATAALQLGDSVTLRRSETQ